MRMGVKCKLEWVWMDECKSVTRGDELHESEYYAGRETVLDERWWRCSSSRLAKERCQVERAPPSYTRQSLFSERVIVTVSYFSKIPLDFYGFSRVLKIIVTSDYWIVIVKWLCIIIWCVSIGFYDNLEYTSWLGGAITIDCDQPSASSDL